MNQPVGQNERETCRINTSLPKKSNQFSYGTRAHTADASLRHYSNSIFPADLWQKWRFLICLMFKYMFNLQLGMNIRRLVLKLSHRRLLLSLIDYQKISLRLPFEGNSASEWVISLSKCMPNACEWRSAVASATWRTV